MAKVSIVLFLGSQILLMEEAKVPGNNQRPLIEKNIYTLKIEAKRHVHDSYSQPQC